MYWNNIRQLRIPKKSVTPGRTYNFNIWASSVNSDDLADYANQVVTVVIQPEALSVVVSGGDSTQKVNNDLTLSSAATTGRRLQDAYTCTWTCEDWTTKGINPLYSSSITEEEIENLDAALRADLEGFSPEVCKNHQDVTLSLDTQTNSQVVIPANTFPSGKLYYFKSACIQTSETYSGYSWIKTIATTSNGRVSIAPKNLKPNWNNQLTATFTSDYSDATVQWELLDATSGFNFSSRTDRSTVSFSSDALQANTVYTFKATLIENGSATEVYAELSTVIESPPYGGSFVVSADSGVVNGTGTKDTEWILTFANWSTVNLSDISYRVYLRSNEASNDFHIAGTSSDVEEFRVKFPCSTTTTSFTVYG